MSTRSDKVIVPEMMGSGRERSIWVPIILLLGGYIAVAALVMAISPLRGTLLFCFPLLCFLSFWRTDIILTAFFLGLPFDKLGKLFPADTSYLGILTVPKLLLGLVMLAWIAKVLISKDDRIFQYENANPLTLILLVCSLIGVLSLAGAYNKAHCVFYLVRRLSIFLLFVVLINMIRDERLLDRLLLATLVSYAGVALVGIYEFVTGKAILVALWGEGVGRVKELPYLVGQQGTRIRGFTGDPDFHGVSMLLPMMIALVKAILTRSRICKIAMMVLIGLFAFNVLATGSRGTALCVVGAVLIFFVLSRFRRRFLTIGVILFVLGGLFIFARVETTLLPMERFTGKSGSKSIQYRFGLAQMAFEMIRDHPFIGVGTGTFVIVYHRYLNPKVPKDPLWTHNSFLQVWAENGLVAFLLYIAGFVFAGRNFYLTYRKAENETLRVKALALFATLCGYFLFAGTSNVLENEYYGILFALSVAITVIDRHMQVVPE